MEVVCNWFDKFDMFLHKWNCIIALFAKEKKLQIDIGKNVMRSKVGVASGEGIADLQKNCSWLIEHP